MSRDLRVLVVEDDEALRKLLCAFLERHGCIVAAAGDGVFFLPAPRRLKPWESPPRPSRRPLPDAVADGESSDSCYRSPAARPRVAVA